MNRRMVLHTLGAVVEIEAVLMLLPAAVSLYYREIPSVYSFLATIALAVIVGIGMMWLSRPRDRVIYAKEGFAIVAASWICLSLIGAFPFWVSKSIPSYIDAFFETVSGFTTTGASILPDVEALSHGMLFWRSFTHWIGGMGILVFAVAILPGVSDRSIHILRAEVPGPVVGKLVPRIRDTAKILYLIYIGITVLQVIFLLAGGMPLFDSLVHTFGTAGTGGFGIKQDSIASYSPYLQWVITIFMLLFGVNFNLYYLILARRAKLAFQSSELWTYLGIVVASIIAVTINIYPTIRQFSTALRLSAFQVSSIITTTGYTTCNYDTWPSFSKTILLLLCFIGGCAGSTAGGIKVARIVMLFKIIRREVRKLLHPRSVGVVRFEGKRVEEPVLSGVSIFFVLFLLVFSGLLLLVSMDGFNLETNFSAVTACINNVGPGFALVGPSANYSCYGPFSTIVLSFAMLFGRLEIYPLLLFFIPSTWTKK